MNYLFVLIGLVSGLSINALAVEGKVIRRSLASDPEKVTTTRNGREIIIRRDQSGTGFGFFMGAGGGAFMTVPRSGLGELDSQGSHLLGRSYFSFYNRLLQIDVGGAWMYSSTQFIDNSGYGIGGGYKTRIGMVEFSPKFRLGEYFNLGPAAAAAFGTDSGFLQSSNGMQYPVFVGAKGGVNFELKDIHVRLYVQGMTSLNIVERQASLLSGGIEIGIPFVRGKSKVRETEVTTIRDRMSRETILTQVEVAQPERAIASEGAPSEPKIVEKIVEKVIEKEVLVYSLDDEMVNFEFNSDQLREPSQSFIKELGLLFASRPYDWEKVRVVGHTDVRGTEEYNQELSTRRSKAIAQSFMDQGVAAEKLEVIGKGKSEPIFAKAEETESELTHARNRRVELHFEGVKDATKLRSEINRIKLQTFIPATCNGHRCR